MKIFATLFGVVALACFAAAPVSAAPAVPAPAAVGDAVGATKNLLTPVHGWHRYCSRGHRHTSWGRVRCGRAGWRRGRCTGVRRSCHRRWNGWRARRCIIRRGC